MDLGLCLDVPRFLGGDVYQRRDREHRKYDKVVGSTAPALNMLLHGTHVRGIEVGALNVCSTDMYAVPSHFVWYFSRGNREAYRWDQDALG